MIDKNNYIGKFKTLLNEATNKTKLIEIKNIFIKNEISSLYKEIHNVENKREFGIQLNELKNEIEEIYNQYLNKFDVQETNSKIEYDYPMLNEGMMVGSRHILNLVLSNMLNFFKQLNFEIVSGNELVSDYHNFTALNIPKNHPARNLSDSFFINENLLLRTHCTATSAQKIANNENTDIRVASFGNVYRKDDDDPTHSHQFMQLDIVWINSDLNVSNLKWIIESFLKYLFGSNTKTRFRLSYFPFTEPSFEVDVSCFKCQQQGCNICKKTGWIEILGAGMLNINVLNISNTNVKNGLAAGIGIERIAMLKYGIDDIRNFYQNDFEIVKQFKNIPR
ncbi:MAG: phenylalanine--tRNA ligase subunit alpha [Ureaplasma sp.]|nr:phenylalanine--tRNA ligase subunit alpha [Ureaplasma sp.]MDE7221829.1 phenylalanine--tRNA ligase subunit alpha [Ureaplasma sp.]